MPSRRPREKAAVLRYLAVPELGADLGSPCKGTLNKAHGNALRKGPGSRMMSPERAKYVRRDPKDPSRSIRIAPRFLLFPKGAWTPGRASRTGCLPGRHRHSNAARPSRTCVPTFEWLIPDARQTRASARGGHRVPLSASAGFSLPSPSEDSSITPLTRSRTAKNSLTWLPPRIKGMEV